MPKLFFGGANYFLSCESYNISKWWEEGKEGWKLCPGCLFQLNIDHLSNSLHSSSSHRICLMSLMLICLVVQIIAYIFVIKLLPKNPNLMWVAKTLLTFYLYWAFGICFLMRKKRILWWLVKDLSWIQLSEPGNLIFCFFSWEDDGGKRWMCHQDFFTINPTYANQKEILISAWSFWVLLKTNGSRRNRKDFKGA